jgi:hypothetical protein
MKRLAVVLAAATLVVFLIADLGAAQLVAGKGGPPGVRCSSGQINAAGTCHESGGHTLGPLNSISGPQVCLGFAGGPPPLQGEVVDHCFDTAAFWRRGRGVDVGSYVELHFDEDGRVASVNVYRGPRPV